ncbi:hypothetical protein DFJ77DRAFT_545541 [Powellomyces hirtus]|nr:hypothetical protein DFJ77DRAFT_545541 [Powellomyces hirtus]
MVISKANDFVGGGSQGPMVQVHRTAELTQDETRQLASNDEDRTSYPEGARFHYQNMSSAEVPTTGFRSSTIKAFLRFPAGRKSLISRPGVNILTPLWRVVDPHANPTTATIPPNTALFTDAIYALCLYRTLLVLTAAGLNRTGILRFLLVFIPFHSTYVQLILDHDRHFAKHDTFHLVYTGARIGTLFSVGFTVPMVFNTVDSTWMAFAALMLIARGAHAFIQICVGSWEQTAAERAWWLISFRAAAAIAPCILWGASMGLGNENLHTRDIMWIAAVAVDQACLLAIGLAEAAMERKCPDSRRPRAGNGIASERCTHNKRIGRLTSFILASGMIGLFEQRYFVANPDSVIAIPLYPRSLLCAVVGLMIIYALERIYWSINPYLTSHAVLPNRIATSTSLPTDNLTHPIPGSPILIFLRTYLHLPLYGFILLAWHGLQGSLQIMYASFREQPFYDYSPPPNPPFVSAANVAQNVSPIAKLYVTSYNADMPYATSLFTNNPVTGGSSALSDSHTWTLHQLFSISTGLLLLVMALMAGLLAGGERPNRTRSLTGFLVRLLIAVGASIPALVTASAQVTLFALAILLVITALIADSFTPPAGQGQCTNE